MPIKSILASKTMWLNAIAFVLFVLALPQFISVIPDNWIPAIALLTAVLNGVLRLFFTNQPITQIAATQPLNSAVATTPTGSSWTSTAPSTNDSSPTQVTP